MAHAGLAHTTMKLQRNARYLDKIQAAAVDCREVLADGQWHSKSELVPICKRHGVGAEPVLDEMMCAISDSTNSIRGGKTAWVCIPAANTPELAPGETEGVPDVLRRV